jgi:CRISPR-associated protein Csm2
MIAQLTTELQSRPKFLSSNFGPEHFAVPGGHADQIAGELKEMKTTQLRKVFAAIKTAQKKAEAGQDFTNDLAKMMPQLAYALGRKLIPKEFYELLKACLMYQGSLRFGKPNTKDDFLSFVSFLEAVVAYNKKYKK